MTVYQKPVTNNKRKVMTDIKRKGTEYRCADIKELVDEVIESLSKKDRNTAIAERYEEDYSILLSNKLAERLISTGIASTLIEKYRDVLVEEVRLYSDDDSRSVEMASMAISEKDTSEELKLHVIHQLAQEYGFFLL